jgi:hypothetical protein
MTINQTNVKKLCSYGTLQQHDVQQGTFGRTLLSLKDELMGHRLDQVHIVDSHVIAVSGKRCSPHPYTNP